MKNSSFSLLKLFKQTFWSALKNKMQIILLILLTFILSTAITLTWISSQWIYDGINTMGIKKTSIDYGYSFSSKTILRSQTIAPTLNICNFYSNIDIIENEKQITASTPSINISSNNDGCIKPLNENNLLIEKDTNNNIKKISFKNLLDWQQINEESIAFKSSTLGQLYKKMKTNEAEREEFKYLYDSYKELIEAYINPIFSFYLTNFYLSNKEKLDKLLNDSQPTNLANFKKYFLKEYVNPKENESWLSKVNSKRTNDWKSDERIAILAGAVEIPNQFNENKYEQYFKETNNFEKRSFFKQGFKGLLGNILLNIDSKQNIIFEYLQDYRNSNFDYDYLIDKKELILPITGEVLHNNWSEIHKIWEWHNLLLGKLTNFNINVRKEYLFSDFSNNIKYRVIALNPMNKNTNNDIRIIKGAYPQTKKQIAINEQFAEKHNYKIGDTLKIGSYELTIVAFGGDNFTILPIVNELNFLPNPEKEAIIFVNPELYIENNNFIRYSDVYDISQVYLQYYGNNMNYDLQKFRLFLNDAIHNNTNNIANTSEKILNYCNNPQQLEELTKDDLIISSNIKSNNPTNFINRGFNSINSVATGYINFSIVVVVFMSFLVTFISIIIIRRDIEKNSTQLGILKALGYKSKTIIISYWVYGLLISLIAIPTGWIAGSLLQLYIMEILKRFFILPTNVFYIDFIPLIICFVINISISLISASITTYNYLKRNARSLLHPNSNVQPSKSILKIYHRFFSFSNFKIRFSIILAAVSYKKIIFMLITIMLSSLAISVSLMLPAAITSLDSSYYDLLKYQSGAEFNSPIYNVPTSRLNLYAWDGVDAKNKDIEYPIHAIKPISDYYGELDAKNEIIWKETSTNTDNVTIDEISKQLAFNYYWTGGRGISLGWLKKLSTTYSKNSKLSNLLSTIVCPMVSSILTADIEVTEDWENCILQAIQTAVPSYVKELLNKESRKDRFVVSHNASTFNSLEDELFTYYENEYKNLSFKAFGIKPESKMITIKDKTIIENEEIKNNQIPVIINNSMQTIFDLKINDTFQTTLKNHKELQYEAKDNNWYPISKEWWFYESETIDWQEDPTEKIYNIPLDKWSLNDDKSLFGWQTGTTPEGEPKIKKYYNLNNLILKLPKTNETNSKGIKDDFLTKINNLKIPTNNSKTIIYQHDNWWYIRAFAPFGKENQYVDKNLIENPLNLLSQSTNTPLWNLFTSLTNQTIVKKEKVPQLLKIANVNITSPYVYHVKGIHTSYEDPKIFLNQNIANQILNFNTTKFNTLNNFYIKEEQFPEEEFLWFNGRYSSNPELTDVTSQYNVISKNGDYSIASLSYNISTMIEKLELLSIKRELIQNLIRIASSVTSFFILGVIAISIIIVIIISNMLIHQFAKIMAMMKIEGYRNREINNLTLLMFIPTTIIGFTIGFALSWIVSKIALWSLGKFTGIIIPLYFHWWILIVALGIIAFIYIITYIFSLETLKRIKPLKLMQFED